MSRNFKGFALLCLLLALTSCAAPVRLPTEEGPVVYDSQPAVVALLSDAERETGAGDLDRAAAALERALRIDPGDAMAWHQLAKLRLQQGAINEAISLANKSTQLANDTPALQRANWRLVADAYDEKGDTAKARRARERAFGN
ncbi:MAG: tetratricopeptide repeat protein [Gammaproteobacteria bacterium]|nr:tetratricopeptide repeat protein [Gammaproteobacteria bacterium]